MEGGVDCGRGVSGVAACSTVQVYLPWPSRRSAPRLRLSVPLPWATAQLRPPDRDVDRDRETKRAQI